jgi:branched-subunit amino acid transport protein
MSTLVAGIILLALMNIAFKAFGPALLGDRRLPSAFDRVLRALGQGLLASLVVATLLGADWAGFDGTILPGLAVALGLRLWGQSHLVCALAAVIVTAAVRLVA